MRTHTRVFDLARQERVLDAVRLEVCHDLGMPTSVEVRSVLDVGRIHVAISSTLVVATLGSPPRAGTVTVVVRA